MDFKYLIPSSPTKPKGKKANSLVGLFEALHSNLSFSTLLLVGAFLQTLLTLLPIPTIYSLTPAITVLLIRFINTLLITYGIIPNPYLQNAIPKKSTAQIPDLNGNFNGPGKEKIAVLLLGAKSNHPLGIFAPDFGIVGNYLEKMTSELESDSTQESGFLGQTAWTHRDDNGTNEFVFISYWRSLEDVHRYAHGPTHRAAWKWWESTLKKHNYIGFMHEVFEADKGKWEGVYINFQPTLLGKTTYLKKDGNLVGGEVSEEWITPLMEAGRGKLRTSMGRRGLGDKKEVIDTMFKDDAYAAL